MRKEALILLFLLACNVSAAGMKVTFSDIFPQCTADRTGNYNVLRCGAELIVPNAHVGAIWNMFVKTIAAVFKIVVDFIYAVIGLIVSFNNPMKFLEGVADTIKTVINSGGASIFNDLLSYTLDYAAGVVTPFIVVLMLLTYEMIKTYLVFAIPACLYKSALDEAGQNTKSEGVKILLIFVVCASIFFGTIFLLALDVGIWNGFINWGNQDIPLPGEHVTFGGGSFGGGGGKF